MTDQDDEPDEPDPTANYAVGSDPDALPQARSYHRGFDRERHVTGDDVDQHLADEWMIGEFEQAAEEG